MRPGQGPKQGHRAAGRPISGRLHVDQVDRQRVARLRALDVERAGLWIDERVLDRLAGQVLLRSDLAGKAVLRIQIEHVTGLNAGDRVDAAKGPGVLLLSRNDPLDVNGLDHSSPLSASVSYSVFLEARRSASTWRALARAARRRSSDAGYVILRRLRIVRAFGPASAARPPAGLGVTPST